MSEAAAEKMSDLPPPVPSYTVLVLEDDEDLQGTLLKVLRHAGYRAEATDGMRKGLLLADDLRPDLIVCDVHLRDGDGRDLIQALRRDERTEGCQFVFMTGDAEGASQRSGMDLGADDYLAKPFSMETFLQCVRVRLERRTSYRSAEQRIVRMMRDTMSMTVPHEFLTPLNGIIGLAEYLRMEEGEVSPEALREIASDIGECGKRLLRTVRNYLAILDVMEHPASAFSGREAVEGRAARQILEEVCQRVTWACRREGDLVLESQIDRTSRVLVNLERFDAVAFELIDNAFKFSLEGSEVKVRLALLDSRLLLAVEDRGCGMAEEQLRRLGAFQQFDRRRYAQQGLGLGLTLAQQLLHRDGGDLRIESEVGLGSLMVAYWPQGRSSEGGPHGVAQREKGENGT